MANGATKQPQAVIDEEINDLKKVMRAGLLGNIQQKREYIEDTRYNHDVSAVETTYKDEKEKAEKKLTWFGDDTKAKKEIQDATNKRDKGLQAAEDKRDLALRRLDTHIEPQVEAFEKYLNDPTASLGQALANAQSRDEVQHIFANYGYHLKNYTKYALGNLDQEQESNDAFFGDKSERLFNGFTNFEMPAPQQNANGGAPGNNGGAVGRQQQAGGVNPTGSNSTGTRPAPGSIGPGFLEGNGKTVMKSIEDNATRAADALELNQTARDSLSDTWNIAARTTSGGMGFMGRFFEWAQKSPKGRVLLGVGGGILGALMVSPTLDWLGIGKWPVVGTLLKVGLAVGMFFGAMNFTKSLATPKGSSTHVVQGNNTHVPTQSSIPPAVTGTPPQITASGASVPPPGAIGNTYSVVNFDPSKVVVSIQDHNGNIYTPDNIFVAQQGNVSSLASQKHLAANQSNGFLPIQLSGVNVQDLLVLEGNTYKHLTLSGITSSTDPNSPTTLQYTL